MSSVDKGLLPKLKPVAGAGAGAGAAVEPNDAALGAPNVKAAAAADGAATWTSALPNAATATAKRSKLFYNIK